MHDWHTYVRIAFLIFLLIASIAIGVDIAPAFEHRISDTIYDIQNRHRRILFYILLYLCFGVFLALFPHHWILS